MSAETPRRSRPVVGGGAKKIRYTLETVRRIGLARAAKTLSSNNTCKACGLGMGGQRGGMTDELGEFPSVCNKSVQAQSTDTQPAIPTEVFEHTLDDLRELDERELATLGRLAHPLYKESGSTRFRCVDWDWALDHAAARLRGTDPHRSFFYSSGRSSNEAGFVFQLLARAFGTNNVNNCSYYCHQATSVGLDASIGTGTATIELEDLQGCDLIFLLGANPASNHPRLLHKLKACRDRGGEVIVINPAKEPGLVRFAVPKSPRSMLSGGTWIASRYLQPRIGADIALLKGIGKAVLAQGAAAGTFIEAHTEGFEAYAADLASIDWSEIESATGLSRQAIEDVAACYARAERVVFAWGMGLTHHLHGVENVESVANLALLRGMVGKPHAGLLPLRGHSNVQGIGTIGVKPVLADEVMRRIEATLGLAFPSGEGLDTMGVMQAASRGEMDAAVMMGGNLYGSNPHADWAGAALARIGFKLFLTTTLNRGHLHGLGDGDTLILPVTARDEEWDPTTQESMFNYVRLSDGGIQRLANVRPETWILCELAARLLPGSAVPFAAFRSHRSIREAIAATIPGLEDLASIDVAKREFHIRGRILHQPEFKTASGRAHFSVCAIPGFRTSGDYPFMLTTVRSEGQFNTIVYEDQDAYRQTRSRWCVMMGTADLERLGILPGERVTLHSAHGVMQDVMVEQFDLPPGDLMAYFPEANVLTGTAVDPRSKTPAFKATPVNVVRGSAPG
ncbi:MAG: FdhF/YdeP family oxidoreductase [Steroidobacteraceae bacterium]